MVFVVFLERFQEVHVTEQLLRRPPVIQNLAEQLHRVNTISIHRSQNVQGRAGFETPQKCLISVQSSAYQTVPDCGIISISELKL